MSDKSEKRGREKPEYIQIEAREDVASIRDRLSFIRGKRVLLIWPEAGTALTRKLDLVLVQREAVRRAIQLAIVTHDETVIAHAQELNISTFETIGSSERGRWKRGRTRAFLPREHKPEDEPDAEDLMPFASRLRATRKRMSNAMLLGLRMLSLGVVIGALIGLTVIVYPSADIYITPLQTAVLVETSITADPNALDLDVENGVIPATILRAPVQTVQQIQTTGVQQVQDSRAVGVVTATNTSPNPLTIPVGTQVSTSTSPAIIFQTTIQQSIAAGGRADIAIEALADYAGSQGNLEAGLINTVLGELSTSLEVINLRPTIGGASEAYAFVTEADRERLMRTVRGQLQSLAFTAMEAQLLDQQVIVIESLTIPEDGTRNDWIRYSHNVGDRSDTLALEMRAVVEAIAIDDRLARQIVFARLSTEKPPRLSLLPETFHYTRGQFLENTPEGQIRFMAAGEGVALAEFDHLALAEALRGASADYARDYILQNVQLAENSSVDLRLSPAWLGRLPLLAMRIQIHEN